MVFLRALSSKFGSCAHAHTRKTRAYTILAGPLSAQPRQSSTSTVRWLAKQQQQQCQTPIQKPRFSVYAPSMKDITVTFIEPDGNEVVATGEEGTNLMELAHENDVDLEGACEGACACSTCHVILEEKIYDELPEPTDEENDMLDLAFGLTDTSRLGCQVLLTPEMEGMRIKLPSATRNFYVDGAKPAHH
ncbi:mitochondrial matrix iron-sulfur protein [Coemansia sp. RSA 2599]|nr:mitochondrial matrix iron-sulfur protein [Coemansia sp. RSA 2598]KAJ1827217.1 mitochondrial matrix iron-sulfur protein [Coemansia sp. RSA 2599]